MNADDDLPQQPDYSAHGATAAVPPTPVVKPAELSSGSPFALVGGDRYTIGWQGRPEKKGGSGFVILRVPRGALGTLKVMERYPLTDEGWAEAWQKITMLDPNSAERARGVLAHRVAEPPSATPAAAEAEPAERWKPLTSEERKALTPEEKKARRQQWWAMSPQERRDQLNEITEAAQRERLQKKGMAFYGLGVRVRDGQVYPYPALGQPALGPAKGARAEITDPTKAQMVSAGLASGLALGAIIGPFALAPGLLRKSKAVAFVVCTNGKVHEKNLDGTTAIRAAQSDAVKFNVLVGPEDQPTTQPQPPTPSERLEEVTRLRDEGLLTDEEYQAKRAEIISQL